MGDGRVRNVGAAVVGIGLVALGIFMLLGQWFHLDFLGLLWPFFIIVPGLLFFVGMFALGKNGAPMAVPGSIVTMVGMILLYQNLTGHWASWAYAWALIFPTAVGLGIAISGLWSGDPKATKTGTTMAGIGVAVFVFFAIFFELLLNISGFRSGLLGQIFFPGLIILAGVALLFLALTRGRR